MTVLSLSLSSGDGSLYSSSLIHTQLNEAIRNRVGLRECISDHVLNLVETQHRSELFALRRDCLDFFNQIQAELPTILAFKDFDAEEKHDNDYMLDHYISE